MSKRSDSPKQLPAWHRGDTRSTAVSKTSAFGSKLLSSRCSASRQPGAGAAAYRAGPRVPHVPIWATADCLLLICSKLFPNAQCLSCANTSVLEECSASSFANKCIPYLTAAYACSTITLRFAAAYNLLNLDATGCRRQDAQKSWGSKKGNPLE